VEFQKELQGTITDLVKLTAAHTNGEYTQIKGDADKSLALVKGAQQLLEEMSSAKMGADEELVRIAEELYTAV
jgi:hypothetical protein